MSIKSLIFAWVPKCSVLADHQRKNEIRTETENSIADLVAH